MTVEQAKKLLKLIEELIDMKVQDAIADMTPDESGDGDFGSYFAIRDTREKIIKTLMGEEIDEHD